MTSPYRRVVLLGLDGLDPGVVETLWRRGELPNLAGLRERGGWARIRTTTPAQTPVAWSTVATGLNPGVHGIFDFLTRDPESYAPDVALFGFERRGAFLPPKLVNRRRGTPLWTRLEAAGIPSTVLRFPGTFPPDKVLGRMLSGVGVPDLRGGFGTSMVFLSSPGLPPGEEPRAAHLLDEPGENEELHPLRSAGDGTWEGDIPGPRLPDGARATVRIRLAVTAGRGAADSICRVELPDGCAETFGMESWSPWLPVRFKLGAFHWIRGQLRARVSGETDRPVLYVSPVHPDPSEPPHPISHPWEYAGDIARESGRFHTLGMSEEHQGLNNGRLDEAAYLDQCRTVMAERRALLLEELHRTTHGLVACVFDTPDRLQHMFWRFREEDHPANGALGFDPAWQATVDEHYGECDDVVGEVVGSLSDHDLLLVLSDHGFGTFRRELHLNTILHRAGLLHLREGALPGDGARDLLGNVDWTRTRAYALGLSGVYLNLEGREGEGIVPADEATATAQDVARVLSATRDPENPGDRPLRWVRPRESVYRGAATTHAPDVLVGCAPGYRISSRTAMGGFDGEMFSPNQRGWAGDHVVDPDAVPGILVSGAPIDTTGPDLLDIAPTVLAALGVPEEGSRPGHEPLEGRSLL